MKKTKLSILVVLLVVMATCCSFAIATFKAPVKAATIVQPTSFSGNSLNLAGNTEASPKGFRLGQAINGAAKTIEALIIVPTTANEGSRYGVVIGSFVNGTSANADCFDLEIHGGGNPRLYWYNGNYSGKDDAGNAKGFSWRLTDVNIATNTWTHLAFVRDTVNNKTYCYVNGEKVGTYDSAGADFVPGSLSGSIAGNLSVGKDNRDLVSAGDTKATYFQGNIAYVAVSSTIKSQDAVKQSMSNMASVTATASQGNLLFLDYAKTLDYKGEGLDVSNANGYGIMETMTAAPRTFEALVKVNPTTKLSSGRYGVIIGNFFTGDVANNDCFDLEIHQNGNPRLFWHNGSYSKKADDNTPNGFDWILTNVKLNTGDWVHIAFVRDMSADKTYCYVNGSIVGTLNEAGKDIVPGTLSGSKCGGLKIGMDSRTNANTITSFQGDIGYIALSSKTKTASEIRESAALMEKCAVNKEMTKSVADLLLLDKSTTRTYYRAARALESNPNTITATFKLPKAYGVGFNGAIFGNVAQYASVHGYNLEINQKGHLCVVWNAHKSPNANPWIEFSQDFRTGEWTTVTVVRDKTANCFKLYVNGVYIESSSTSTGVGSDSLSTYAPAIGSNFQTQQNERLLFRGYIKEVAVFSTALSATEVANFYNTADKTKVSKTQYPSMMLNWVLAEKQQRLYYDETCTDGLIDYSGNENHAHLCTSQDYVEITEETKDWFKAGDDEYTLIFMPDTQITVSRDVQFYETNANVKSIADLDMTKTFKWRVDNKDAMNLSFVMHMGDLKHARGVSENWVAQNDWREWELISGKAGHSTSHDTSGSNAKSPITFSSSFINGETFGFELLKEAGIPYTVVVGNHDYNAFQMGEGTGRNADYFNYYFSSASYDEKFADNIVARYDRNHSKYAKNNNTMMNVIYEIDATPKGSSVPVKYLVVALEYGPTDDMLAWANEIVSQPKYSAHRVIVNTHAMMYSDGEFMGATSNWLPSSYGYSKDEGTLETNNGIDIYNKLIKGNDNMFMSSGGHVSQEGLMTRNDLGVFSNNVHSVLVDWQDSFNSRGDSILLVAKVNEKTKKITFRVYNPIKNEFYCLENEEIVYDFSDSLTREVKKDDNVNYNKNHAVVGEKVEFTLNKQSGYKYRVVVTDVLGNNIPVTQTQNAYTFTMPGAKVEITTYEEPIINVNLPSELELDVGDTLDLSTYLNNSYNYTYSIDGTSISIENNIITALSAGTATITLSIDGYGEYATCSVVVKQKVVPPSSSSSSSSKEESSSSSIISSSSSQAPSSSISSAISSSSSVSSEDSSVVGSSQSSSSEIISSSSTEQSSSSQQIISSTNPPTSSTETRGGCMATMGSEYFVVLVVLALASVVILLKKKTR